jgi:PAS domain-containing protein
LLRHAQEQLRYNEAARQTAILNALPANIALLDTRGVIVSVNESWRRFAVTNVLHCPGYAVGVNYLEICDSAKNDCSAEARQVAEGIRAVLQGVAKSFSIEYPCYSPAEQRWFLLTVTPLGGDRTNGAVVMHVDITERKQIENALRKSDEKFHHLADNINDVFWITSPDLKTMHYVSAGYERIWGRSKESIYENPHQWIDVILPDDRDCVISVFGELMKKNRGQRRISHRPA